MVANRSTGHKRSSLKRLEISPATFKRDLEALRDQTKRGSSGINRYARICLTPGPNGLARRRGWPRNLASDRDELLLPVAIQQILWIKLNLAYIARRALHLLRARTGPRHFAATGVTGEQPDTGAHAHQRQALHAAPAGGTTSLSGSPAPHH
jgi:hypothetical protein